MDDETYCNDQITNKHDRSTQSKCKTINSNMDLEKRLEKLQMELQNLHRENKTFKKEMEKKIEEVENRQNLIEKVMVDYRGPRENLNVRYSRRMFCVLQKFLNTY